MQFAHKGSTKTQMLVWRRTQCARRDAVYTTVYLWFSVVCSVCHLTQCMYTTSEVMGLHSQSQWVVQHIHYVPRGWLHQLHTEMMEYIVANPNKAANATANDE